MENKGHRKITDLLALMVFAVFAFCVAAVLLLSARTYNTLTERGSRTYEHRTGTRYLTTRFQQAESVYPEDFCGLSAMTVRDEINGKNYLTRVYLYEGTVRELFSGENAKVFPEDGQVVMEAQALSFLAQDGLLTAEITLADGTVEKVLLWLPNWKEAAP